MPTLGRTDSNGGHYNRKTGEYHYHDGLYSGQSQSITIEENENKTSWEEFKEERNLSQDNTSSSLKNTTPITKSEDENLSFGDILGYVCIGFFFFLPVVGAIIGFIGGTIQIIYKEIFKKNNNTQTSTKIYTTDYTISSNQTETTEIKPIQNQITESSYICPKCSGQLQIKNGKYGKFIGCKNYPNCKYTKSLKNKR